MREQFSGVQSQLSNIWLSSSNAPLSCLWSIAKVSGVTVPREGRLMSERQSWREWETKERGRQKDGARVKETERLLSKS